MNYEILPNDLKEVVDGMTDPELELVKGLNVSQLRAVTSVDGIIQICSVAGSGKTTVLTRRTAYLLKKGVNPGSILLTTFTKKAAEEMSSRLANLIPASALRMMTIGTTHSIGYRILNKEYDAMNHPLASAFKKDLLINTKLKIFLDQTKKDLIYDRTLEFTIKQVLTEMPMPMISKMISLAKNEGLDPYDFERKHYKDGVGYQAVAEMYKRYEQKKMAERVIDADDLLYLLVKLFEENPAILAKYQKMYQYIMVDEAQDNNAQQWKLMKMLSKQHKNLFIVGDDDQSMYGFRGAKPDEFIKLSSNFNRVSQVSLEDNYRSNPDILKTANALIAYNQNRISKFLKANKTSEAKSVMYNQFQSANEESSYIASEIKTLCDTGESNYKDIAVLIRTNAQSRALEDNMIMSGIPYVIHGGVSFYERKEVKDLIAYLQLVIDSTNDKAFDRVINVPSRYLGKAFLEKVRAVKGDHYSALDKIDLKGYEKSGVDSFKALIQEMKYQYSKGATASDLIDFLMSDCYEAHLNNEDEEEDSPRLENVATLRYVLSRYEKVEDFLSYVDMMTSKAKHAIDGVQIMTVHKSKGLEFPTVFIFSLNEGSFPHHKAAQKAYETNNEQPIEEERRLAYVAITRAESRCYISASYESEGRRCAPSRFVREMKLTPENIEQGVGAE